MPIAEKNIEALSIHLSLYIEAIIPRKIPIILANRMELSARIKVLKIVSLIMDVTVFLLW